MKIPLKDRVVPLNAKGDPSFSTLVGVQAVFTDQEICEMVNRYLYQTFYQHQAHLKRAARRTEELKPLRLMLRKMFNTTLDKATDEQVAKAKKALTTD